MRLLALLLASGVANATPIAYVDLDNGGRLFLADTVRNCSIGKDAVIIMPFKNDTPVLGCWNAKDNRVTVIYRDGIRMEYTYDAINLLESSNGTENR